VNPVLAIAETHLIHRVLPFSAGCPSDHICTDLFRPSLTRVCCASSAHRGSHHGRRSTNLPPSRCLMCTFQRPMDGNWSSPAIPSPKRTNNLSWRN
jgi:hypothetical protein